MYKYSYWLYVYILLLSCLLTFLNEYCIVLYCNRRSRHYMYCRRRAERKRNSPQRITEIYDALPFDLLKSMDHTMSPELVSTLFQSGLC